MKVVKTPVDPVPVVYNILELTEQQAADLNTLFAHVAWYSPTTNSSAFGARLGKLLFELQGQLPKVHAAGIDFNVAVGGHVIKSGIISFPPKE